MAWRAARLLHRAVSRHRGTQPVPCDLLRRAGGVRHWSDAAGPAVSQAAAQQPSSAHGVTPNDVFVNQELDLNSIQWIGFDCDYTIAAYKPALGETIYELAKHQLMTARQYPDSLRALTYDPNFAVRGVAYDTRRGYLLKLDFLHAVSLGNAFFGRRQMTAAELMAAYGSLVISGAELAAFRPLVDLFCLPEACLISDVIQHFVDRGTPFHPAYVYSDVKSAVGHLHESGILHGAISSQPEVYIEESPGIVDLLRTLRAAGRRTFMLTNSGFRFVSAVLNHITRHSLPPGEWLSLFDLVRLCTALPHARATDAGTCSRLLLIYRCALRLTNHRSTRRSARSGR